MYEFTPPVKNVIEKSSWETITLSLPADTPLAVPADPERWKQHGGRIVATYTREELEQAVKLALEQKRAALEARLERGLEILAQASGCDDTKAEWLLARWDTIVAEYGRVMDRLRVLLPINGQTRCRGLSVQIGQIR